MLRIYSGRGSVLQWPKRSYHALHSISIETRANAPQATRTVIVNKFSRAFILSCHVYIIRSLIEHYCLSASRTKSNAITNNFELAILDLEDKDRIVHILGGESNIVQRNVLLYSVNRKTHSYCVNRKEAFITVLLFYTSSFIGATARKYPRVFTMWLMFAVSIIQFLNQYPLSV